MSKTVVIATNNAHKVAEIAIRKPRALHVHGTCWPS